MSYASQEPFYQRYKGSTKAAKCDFFLDWLAEENFHGNLGTDNVTVNCYAFTQLLSDFNFAFLNKSVKRVKPLR